jgi:hypothetical protein
MTLRHQHIQVICILIASSAVFLPATASTSRNQSLMSQVKEYAFASCIFEKYKDNSLSFEADAWASGIIENGNLKIEAYSQLSELSKNTPEVGTTQRGASMKLEACFKFINSSEFERNARHILRKQ